MKVLWTAVFLLAACSQSYALNVFKRLRPPPRKWSCDPVKCEDNCREAVTPSGCPTCICDPMCSPPKCPPGCKIETDFKGPCPGCDCEKPDEGDEDIEWLIPDILKALCDPVKCEGNCREALGPNGCPTCLCDPLCSPPKCEPGCVIETEFEGPCPGCKCVDRKDERPPPKWSCDPVKCESNCREAVTPSGCPTCICGPVCSPPKCPPGCKIETNFKGPCPGCDCGKFDDEDIGELKPDLTKALCDPVKCERNCREALGPNGCPTCLCDPLCSPPKCEPGCVIETEFEGPCPGCKCDDRKNELPPPKWSCDPVKCEDNCREAVTPSGCPTCICGPVCSPPKCPPGCKIETDFKGPCPGCDCIKIDEDIDVKPKCPPAEECSRPDCSKQTNEQGCEMCVCEPICDPPKCGFGCRLRPPKTPKGCPTCVCLRPWSKGHRN